MTGACNKHEKVKVVQVISDTNIGGAGKYLLNYLSYYDKDRFSVSVIVPQNSKLTPFIKKFDGVTLTEAPAMADKSYDRHAVSFLTQKFKDERPDIIHTHASLSARVAARKAKTGIIIATRHCIEPIKTGLQGRLISAFNNRLCDIYIAVADAVRENLLQSGIRPEKIKVIYNGVNEVRKLPNEKVAASRAALGIKDDETVFGMFARLEPVKGHKYFIKAAREFLKTSRRAKFIVAGDGSLLDELKNTAVSYSIDKSVIFTGFVNDTTELLNATDVNVIASSSEALSLSILEAMSLSKPTIATNVGGNGQLVKTGLSGILVGAADSTSLKEAMIRLSDDKKLYYNCAMGAREEYEERFTARKMVSNLEELYTQLLSSYTK